MRCAPEIEKLFESVARSCMITQGSNGAAAAGGATQSQLAQQAQQVIGQIDKNAGNMAR